MVGGVGRPGGVELGFSVPPLTAGGEAGVCCWGALGCSFGEWRGEGWAESG